MNFDPVAQSCYKWQPVSYMRPTRGYVVASRLLLSCNSLGSLPLYGFFILSVPEVVCQKVHHSLGAQGGIGARGVVLGHLCRHAMQQ